MNSFTSNSSFSLLNSICNGAQYLPCTINRSIPFLPIIFVIFSLISGYYFVIISTFNLHSFTNTSLFHSLSNSLFYLLFHILYLFILISYLLCVFTDPGTIPISWKRSSNSSQHENPLRPLNERDSDGNLRFCKHCMNYKPDRSHHCKSCRKCILKMDHHCVFIANCVGFYNQKYFILFLITSWIGCILASITGFHSVQHFLFHSTESNQNSSRFPLILIMYVVIVSMTASLSVFVPFHCYLTSIGLTTIESYENMNASRMNMLKFYDRGCFMNWKSTCGDSIWTWFLPIRYSIQGNGLNYNLNHHQTSEFLSDTDII